MPWKNHYCLNICSNIMGTLRWKAIKCEKCLWIHKNQLKEIVQMNAHFVLQEGN